MPGSSLSVPRRDNLGLTPEAPCCHHFAAILLTVLCTSCFREDDGHIFTYSQEQPAGSLRSQSMEFFKEELEKRTGGRIQVELFFGGTLGTERELMDFVALGALQGTRGGLFADANPKFKLLTLPFLVADWDEALRLVNSPFMQKVNQEARDRGWHVPATGISQGFRVHTNSKHPLVHPDDLKGLRMRVPPQDVFVQTALAFGANPQEIPAIEVYQALQTGRVDGQDNAASNIWDYKLYEVSEFMTVTNYATGPDPFFVNLAWYESLPVDLQQIFDEVARETISFSDRLNRAKEEEYIKQLSEKLEVNYVRDDALEPFREAVRPVYEHYIDRGEFTWNEIESARKAARGEE